MHCSVNAETTEICDLSEFSVLYKKAFGRYIYFKKEGFAQEQNVIIIHMERKKFIYFYLLVEVISLTCKHFHQFYS